MLQVYENSPRSGCYEELATDTSTESRLQKSAYNDKKRVSINSDCNGNVLRVLHGDVRWKDYFHDGYRSTAVDCKPMLEYVSEKKVELIEKNTSQPHQDLRIHSVTTTSQSEMINSSKQLMPGPKNSTSKNTQSIEESSGVPNFNLDPSTVSPRSETTNNSRAHLNWGKMKGAIRMRNWKTRIMSSDDSNDNFEHKQVEMSGLKKESVAMGSVVIETIDDEGILDADDCIEAFPEDLPDNEEIFVISRSFEHNANAVRDWRKLQSSMNRIAERDNEISPRDAKVFEKERSIIEESTEEDSSEAEEEQGIISGVRRKQIKFRHNFEENDKLHYMTEESYVETDKSIEALPQTRSSLGDVIFVSRSFEYNPSAKWKSTKIIEQSFEEQDEKTLGGDCSNIQAVQSVTLDGAGKAKSSEGGLLEKSENNDVFSKGTKVKSGIRRKSVAIMALSGVVKERPGDNANNEERRNVKDNLEEVPVESGVGRANVGVITVDSIEKDNSKESISMEKELHDNDQNTGSKESAAEPEEQKPLNTNTLVDYKKNANVDKIGTDANEKQSFEKTSTNVYERSHLIYLVPTSKDFEPNRSFTKKFLSKEGFGAGEIETVMRENRDTNRNEGEEVDFTENGNHKEGLTCTDFTGQVNTTCPDFRSRHKPGRRATLEDANVLQGESSTDMALYQNQGLGYDADYDDDDDQDNALKFYDTYDADFVDNEELSNLRKADEQRQQTLVKYQTSSLREDLDDKDSPAINSLTSPQIYSFSTKTKERYFGVKQSRVTSSDMVEESQKSYSAPKSVIAKLIDLKIELPSHVKIIKISEKPGALQTTFVSYV